MNVCIHYVGLDAHKETIAVAFAEESSRGQVCEHGQFSKTSAALTRLSSKLLRHGSMLRFCYETGPCGYGIQRQLTAAGHDRVVVAIIATPPWTLMHRRWLAGLRFEQGRGRTISTGVG